MTGLRQRPVWHIYVVAIITLLGASLLRNRLTPNEVPDTPSYRGYSFGSAVAVAEASRTPGYPVFLRVCDSLFGRDAGLQWVVLAHIALHAWAATMLVEELLGSGLSSVISGIAGGLILIANTFWDHGNTIATDAPALSLVVILGVLVLRLWRTTPDIKQGLIIGGLVTVLIFVRPAYLFVLPWLFLMLVFPPTGSSLRSTHAGSSSVLRQRCVVGLPIFVPPVMVLLGWCSFRAATVNDFGLLPFGHQNLAAVTTQLLDEEELVSLPGKAGELGQIIAKLRSDTNPKAFDASARDPLDLRQSSDARTRAPNYMTIENRWDAMTYYVIVPAASQLAETPTQQHRLLANLDRAIVFDYPLRYVRWVMLAFRRGIWGGVADIVMHPIHLTILVAGAMSFYAASVGWLRIHVTHQPWSLCVRSLIVIAISFATLKILFVSLSSPPIGRFADAAMVWFPIAAASLLSSMQITWQDQNATTRDRESSGPQDSIAQAIDDATIKNLDATIA
ncbi:MAG: hypothetical protein AAF745_07910 [Planctomycetota bacterium]